MNLKDKVVVVTGAGSGIGAALCRRFAAEAPASIVALDLDGERATATADAIIATHPGVHAHSAAVDVSDESALRDALAAVADRDGVIDLYVGNAGIGSGAGVDAPDELWDAVMGVNLMAHVYAARALLPAWLERGEGHMLITASAAGLLTNLGDALYSVSKHGAVALAEWLSVTYGSRGLHMTCLCPQGVRTPLLFPEGDTKSDASSDAEGSPDGGDALALSVVRAQRILEPEEVAEVVIEALGDERFLILPHPEVRDYEIARATDRGRWLGAMQRMQAQLEAISAH